MDVNFIQKIEFQPVGNHQFLWEHWNDLCRDANDEIPQRLALKPDKITALIPYLTILDMVNEDTISILLIGRAHDQMWSRNIIADNFLDHLSSEVRQDYKDIFVSLKNYQLGCVTNEMVTTSRGTVVRCSGLLLPLRNATGEAAVSVGYFQYEGPDESIRELIENGPSGRLIESVVFITLGH